MAIEPTGIYGANGQSIEVDTDHDNQVSIDIVAGLLDYLSQPDLIEDKYQRILADLVSATHADSASLRIRDQADGTLQRVASFHPGQSSALEEPAMTQQVSGAAVESGDSSSHIGSKFTQPISAAGQNVGVLQLESAHEGHFSPTRVRLIGMVGNVVGLTLQQGKTWRHLQTSLNELAVLDEIARIITSTLNIHDVYESFAVELQKLVQFDHINIDIVDHTEEKYTTKYAFGPPVVGFGVGESGPLAQSVTGRVVNTGTPLIGNNLSEFANASTDGQLQDGGFLSYIMLPLSTKGEVVGTMGLRSRNADAYGEREKEILERLAGQIAPAVENAGLYEARRMAEIEERRKAGEMESLLTISNVLGGPGAFVEKCKIALECFITSPGVKSASLRVPVGDMNGMKLVAQAGRSAASAPLVIPHDSLCSLAFQRSEIMVVDDYQRHPMVYKSFRTSENRSIIFMPVKTAAGKAIGMVSVVSTEESYFTADRTRYFVALAEGLGALLENAELYQQMISELEQRQLTEEALRESESRFRAMAENTSDVMWELDGSYRYTFCSPNIRAVTGYESTEMIGRSPFDFMLPADALRMREVFGDLAGNLAPFHLVEHTVTHKDSSRFVLESSGMPVYDKSGQFIGYRGVDRDVTERKKAEESLQESAQLATLGELASGIAHELNNPLAAVMTFAHLLKSQDLPGGVGEDVDKIFTESQRAARVVHNLLAFARRHEPEKRYVDVSGAVSRALSLKTRDLAANNIEVITDYERGLPKTMADEHQLTQVFLNIVTNADQTMTETNGGGHLWIKGWKEKKTLFFSFRDDGPGISPENQQKIFDPFFTTKSSGKGTGLGLSMCNRMVRAHGGRIWVESEDGKGTTFHVELPLEGPEGEELVSETGQDEIGKITGRKILVVDDEEVFTDPLCRILSKEGHVVEVARDGEEALKAIGQDKYECILMDVRMPGVGGKELYRQIRVSDEELAKRVIFATGDTLNPETQEFLENTGNAWLGKPFTVEELEERIQECLAQQV